MPSRPKAMASSIPSIEWGNLSEVYLSLQGEGIWVGIPMVLVRLTGCHRRCKYCDTEYALVAERNARIWHGWQEGLPDLVVENPIPLSRVFQWILQAADRVTDWVSFTGGEPLLQAEFLSALGKRLRKEGFRILLETEGGMPERLEKVLPSLTAVAADIKLPSTTGEPLDWKATEWLFRLIAQASLQACAKVVVTPDTDETEFRSAAQMLARIGQETGKFIPLIIQPVTPARFVHERPSRELLLRLTKLARNCLPDVRIVPQIHQLLSLP